MSVLSLAREHPLYEILRLDPLVKEARQLMHPMLAEPQLLEYLYGGLQPRKKLSLIDPLGQRIFWVNAVTKRSRAIRRMRTSMAEEIMRTASEIHRARILSAGCGYLRELDAIPWHSHLDVDIYLAIDRSNEITSRVKRQYLHDGIRAVTAHLWELARFGIVLDGHDQREFHLIYSMSAMDALDDVTAEKLIAKLTSVLAPGGRLLLCNSRPFTADAAFQEAFVGQRPFSRSRTEIEFLLRKIRAQREYGILIDDVQVDEFSRITIERHKIC